MVATSAVAPRSHLATAELWLEAVHRRVRQMPDERWLVQPTGGGEVRDYTWGTAVDEAKRVAAHLRSAYPPGSLIAVLSQNCAHFILMDLAIWFAGHATVPLYPTMPPETIRYVLEHCQARAIFIGKLPVVPSGALPESLDGLACALSPQTSFPTAARWRRASARTTPPVAPNSGGLGAGPGPGVHHLVDHCSRSPAIPQSTGQASRRTW